MKTIGEEFPPKLTYVEPSDYDRLRARAVEMEKALARVAELDLTGTDDQLVRYIIIPIQQAAREALPPRPPITNKPKPCQTTD